MPSNPYDAKGMLIAAIEDDDPVLFLEPKRLYNGPFDGHHDRPVTPWSKHPQSQVPEGYYRVPLDKAAIARPGSELTVLTYGTMVWVSEAAAMETGVDAEIIDLRTLWPLDLDTIVWEPGRIAVPRAPEQVAAIGSSFGRAKPNTGWGMTETNALGTLVGGQEYLDHPSSSGYCLVGAELRVVDDSGAPLPAGERGELQVRGSVMFREYWNRPDATADSFDGDWFRTGDVAYLDADGHLYIVDRIKDLIIRGGENIGCGQVEAALAAHPEVIEAAVYAVPDERLGEEVGATIYGTDALDLDELREFLQQHLARHEVPRYMHVYDGPLPRTASGKLFKRELRDDAVGRLAH